MYQQEKNWGKLYRPHGWQWSRIPCRKQHNHLHAHPHLSCPESMDQPFLKGKIILIIPSCIWRDFFSNKLMGNPVLLKKKKNIYIYIYIYINFYRLHSGLCLEKRWPIYFNNSVVKTNYLVMLGEGLLLAKGFFSTVIVFTGGSPLSREIVSACLIRRTSCAATTTTLDHWQDQKTKVLISQSV